MMASHTDEMVDALSELRVLFPDWRMGQLIANLVTAAGGVDAGAIWDTEDDQLLVAARRLIEQNRGRIAVQSGEEPRNVVDRSCRTNG